jgi:hypothetical protein
MDQLSSMLVCAKSSRLGSKGGRKTERVVEVRIEYYFRMNAKYRSAKTQLAVKQP